MPSLTDFSRWLTALPWRRGFLEWARTDGVMWVYLFKVLIASYLALWLAMRLELPQPSTAITTVFIVMQPFSGHVLAKSVYRVIGTLVGSAFMVLLMALFAQSTELFLSGLALWVGVCSCGAARNRHFRAYGFVLAGYTAVMVGLPVVGHPELVFMAAVWRVLEITLGVLCATLVSATLLPNTAGAALRNTLYQRFGRFAAFVLSGLRGSHDQAAFEATNLRFIAEAVGLEGLRSVSVFEDPALRRRKGRLDRLNVEFMAITTRFNALHQLLDRLQVRGATAVLNAVDPGLVALVKVLEPFAGQVLTDLDAAHLSARLQRYTQGLPMQIRHLRAELLRAHPHADDWLDFHTACELLYRFADELHRYAQTHASLADHHPVRERWAEPFQPQTNWLAAVAAGLRAALVLLVLCALWIATAWPSGAAMTLVSALTVGLSAFSTNPRRMSFQIACGTLAAAVIGIFEVFFVYPQIDGFPLLCLVIAPVIMLGSFLLAKPQWAGYGLGMLVFFGTSSIPGNPTLYNPYGLINDYLAMVFGMLVCAAAGAIILPPNSPWLWRRLEQDLRRRVVFAINAPLPALGSGFESGTRDLLNQAHGLSAGQPQVQHRLLRWTFVVLDVGHAIIELRREQAQLPTLACYAESTAWRQAVRAMGQALVRLFLKPEHKPWRRALAAVEQAIECVQHSVEPFEAHFETSALRRVESYLHFIRTSLLDTRSPFAGLLPKLKK
ncbi:FUSC family protein [Pseudomonas sp. GXZC]|uniref:FUSC family protein n=1 Tax=Pseudomonas sp. GXZC TaxID=3003351 RepID=UPI003FA769A8